MNVIINIIQGKKVFLVAEMAAMILFYLYLAISKRSFKQALLTVIVWPFIIFNFTKGLFLKPRSKQDYPQDVNIIKG